MSTGRWQLVDIGANLTHGSFDADRDAVIERAVAAGVSRIILTGSSAASSRDAAELAAARPEVFRATAGVHPHHAADYDDDVHGRLRELARHAAVVAVGECGLDYYRDFSPRDAQRRAFLCQLELAVETGLPVFLHQRDAHEDFLELLAPLRGRLSGGVAHCFTGDAAQLHDYLALDLHIGITGWICDERRGQHLDRVVRAIPRDRLMIETDAPYLLPRTLRPRPRTRRNEPMYLTEVLRAVAAAQGRPEYELAGETTANARRFFGIDDGQAAL